MEALETRPVRYDTAEIAIAGVFVSINAEGVLSIERGDVGPEDEAPVIIEGDDEAAASTDTGSGDRRAVIMIGGRMVEPEDDEDDGIKPLPERLLVELTAYRTLALRDAVATNPHVAMTARLHKLASDTFQHRHVTGAREATVHHVSFSAQDPPLKDSPSARAISERHQAWSADSPADKAKLWIGSTVSTRQAAWRCWRIASATASTPSTNARTPMAERLLADAS